MNSRENENIKGELNFDYCKGFLSVLMSIQKEKPILTNL